MTNQYHFQLVFLRLLLKRNALSDSKLKIALLQNNQPLDVSAPASETEVKFKKNQKMVDLDSLKTFRFDVNQQHLANSFSIRYEIKGTSEERVRIIPINAEKMIEEYQLAKKVVFQQSFGGENAELTQPEGGTLQVAADHNENDVEGGSKTKRSNSISRSKRPPNLNISKRSASPLKPETIEPTPKPIFGNFPINHQDSQLTMSPISAGQSKLPYLTLNNAESRDEFSLLGVQKKQQSLPLSEIEKVNELIATHHPSEGSHLPQISLKLKIVIAMLFIGIAFLLFDTLSDRKIKRASKPHAHDEGHHQHSKDEGDHAASTAKKSKKSKESRKAHSDHKGKK